jgi:hypothetical protein
MLTHWPQGTDCKVPHLQPAVSCHRSKDSAVAWTPGNIVHLQMHMQLQQTGLLHCRHASAKCNCAVCTKCMLRWRGPLHCTTGVSLPYLLVAALKGHQRRLPALLPHAYGPVATAGHEQAWVERAPLQAIYRTNVAVVGLQVLLTVAGAALMNVSILSSCRHGAVHQLQVQRYNKEWREQCVQYPCGKISLSTGCNVALNQRETTCL